MSTVKKLELMLERQLNEEDSVSYPDFEKMWNGLEQSGHTRSLGMSQAEVRIQYRRRSWRKVTFAASFSLLLAAAPVYAAFQHDWGNLLHGKEGIQAALAQSLGQQLGQSVTRDGVTMTLRTAIVDEKRTVILYTLETGKQTEGQFWDVQKLSLQDEKGNRSEGENNYLQWDEANGRYNGYFESEWTPRKSETRVTLTAAAVQSYIQTQTDIRLDSRSQAIQSFPVGQEGMEKLEVQPFMQSGDKLLLSSAVTFSRPEAKEWTFPEIIAYRNGTAIRSLSGGTYGTPGDNGEYTMKQTFKAAEVPAGETTYKLQYTKLEQDITGPWAFDLQLSKKQMESGTVKTALDLPLEPGDTVNTVENMIITPTQIRVSIRVNSKTPNFSYHKYALDIDGQIVEGARYMSPKDDLALAVIAFERPVNVEIGPETPLTFVGSYKVNVHEEDKEPLQLTNISDQKQTLIRSTGGYPVKWTYYMVDGDLYVETESEDFRFGGVGQTHINRGKDRIIGRPVTINFSGDGNNRAIDVYKDFQGTEASIYMFYYTTDEPERETRVQLQP
ncbi:RNA polymerase sigma factor [Paenibacillus sp. FSL R7-0273]|nr:RNA polymerase sigma factor [Paenibacillus sp. FSL R7-0273]OMF93858.1 RNA polymerase subunit sigma [Paenibacillus sp. FSL R7-0273]